MPMKHSPSELEAYVRQRAPEIAKRSPKPGEKPRPRPTW